MADQRAIFWDPAQRATYLARSAEKSEDIRRQRNGEATAACLDTIWQDLDNHEKDLLGALLVTNRRSFVARHDLPALRGLVAKDLLRYPRGQGGNWMRAARTSYSIAPAVWRVLQAWPKGSRGPAESEALLQAVIAG